jgi:hypothetical protein
MRGDSVVARAQQARAATTAWHHHPCGEGARRERCATTAWHHHRPPLTTVTTVTTVTASPYLWDRAHAHGVAADGAQEP